MYLYAFVYMCASVGVLVCPHVYILVYIYVPVCVGAYVSLYVCLHVMFHSPQHSNTVAGIP